MEKKTMGGLIAALRKSKGMTQKELADILLVSDKAVSRWERNETMPDIALLPAIADVFEISVDELIRGEINNNLTQKSDENDAQVSTQRAKLLFKSKMQKLKKQTTISFSALVFGILCFCICEFGFYKTELGISLAAAFCVISMIIQAVLTSFAISDAVNLDTDSETIEKFKAKAISFCVTIETILFFLSCIVLLIAVSMSTFGFGAAFLIAAALALVFLFFIKPAFVAFSKGKIYSKKQKSNAKLSLKITAVTFAAIMILSVGTFAVNDYNLTLFSKGHEFNDFENFCEFMATYRYSRIESDYVEEKIDDKDDKSYDSLSPYDDLVFPANEDVVRIDYNTDGNIYPITVYTQDDMDKAYHTMNIIWTVYFSLDVLIIAAGVVMYIKKRSK